MNEPGAQPSMTGTPELLTIDPLEWPVRTAYFKKALRDWDRSG